jgi:hypothetical protein
MESHEDGNEPLGSKNGGVLRTCEQVLFSSEVFLIHGVSYWSSHCVFWCALVHWSYLDLLHCSDFIQAGAKLMSVECAC